MHPRKAAGPDNRTVAGDTYSAPASPPFGTRADAPTTSGRAPAEGRARWLKRTLWLLVTATLLLTATGVLAGSTALALLALLETAVLVLGLLLSVQSIRHARRAGQSAPAVLRAVLAAFLPDRLARFVVLELRAFATLARWLFHRRALPAESFSYRSRSLLGPLLLLAIVTTPAEFVLVHLLLPWPWLRWLLMGTAVYALLWLAALGASLRTHPHSIEADTLVLRWHFFHELRIPLAQVTAVRSEPTRAPDGRDGFTVSDGLAWLAVGGRTDVRIELSQPVIGWRFLSPTAPVRIIHVAVDDSARFVQSVARRAAAARGHGDDATTAPTESTA